MSEVPVGSTFLGFSRMVDAHCYETSLAHIDRNAPLSALREELGTCLSLLYQLSCCRWGCHGREHVLEYLSGRAVTHALTAYHLALVGSYDEGLALVRNISEVANLVALFWREPSSIREWLDTEEKERRNNFGPAQVRKRLNKLGPLIAVDAGDYAWLCGAAVHVHPDTRPGMHNPSGVPVLGGVLQPEGLQRVLAALASCIAPLAGSVAHVALVPREKAEELNEAALRLLSLL